MGRIRTTKSDLLGIPFYNSFIIIIPHRSATRNTPYFHLSIQHKRFVYTHTSWPYTYTQGRSLPRHGHSRKHQPVCFGTWVQLVEFN